MKLAEVASGGQNFSFEADIAARQKLPKSPSSDETGGLVMGTPTKVAGDGTPDSSFSPEPGAETSPSTLDKSAASPETNGNGTVANNDQFLPTSESALSMSKLQKRDPVVEVCPDMQVKIADLGNACWVVSRPESEDCGYS